MKGILQRIRQPVERASETVTVCWSDTGLSFLRWHVPAVGLPACMDSASLPLEHCTGVKYSETLHALFPHLRSRRPVIRWIAIGEPAMVLQQAGGNGQRLPAWMEACWKGIPERDLPAAGIADGLDCLGRQLMNWDPFTRDGNGFFTTLDQRACVFAYAGGEVFQRVSRKVEGDVAASLIGDREWMQQTRMLFKNRTGHELRQVFLPHPLDAFLSLEEDGLVLKGDSTPLNWPEPGTVSPEWGFLHLSVLLAGGNRRQLSHPILEKRQQARRRASVFRTASVVLLCGWLMLLASACRHERLSPPVSLELEQRWDAAVQRWQGMDRAWRRQASEDKKREMPFSVVGTVMQSVPRGIGLTRLQVSRIAGGGEEGLAISLEGTCEGSEDSEEFREWIRHLRYARSLGKMENLRFERRDDRLLFHLEGRTWPGGER